jgi:serine/threonine protein kinase
MSPEQANGEKLNHQSDIYSLGVLLYEIVTGFKPFTGDTNTEIFANVAKGKFPTPSKYRSDIPYKLVKIIKKCMHKSRKKRYQNATELIRDLDKFIPWHIQTNKKDLLTRFVQHFEKLEQTTTVQAHTIYTNKPFGTWIMSAAVILIFLFASYQLFKFFDKERFAQLFIKTNAQEYIVSIDGHKLGKFDSRQKGFSHISPGHHELVVEGTDNHGVFMSSFFIEPAGTLTKDIILPVRTSSVILNIASDPPDASVYLDDNIIGTTPFNDLNLRSGKHSIKITKEGYREIIISEEFKQAQNYSLNFHLKHK